MLTTLGSGQFFGEMALIDEYPRSATVAAREATECPTLTKWHFLADIDEQPDDSRTDSTATAPETGFDSRKRPCYASSQPGRAAQAERFPRKQSVSRVRRCVIWLSIPM